MKEEAINPGYSNQIFIWGNPMTHGNHSEIVGGNKTQFLKFDYQKSLQKDFILVKTTSLFIGAFKYVYRNCCR